MIHKADVTVIPNDLFRRNLNPEEIAFMCWFIYSQPSGSSDIYSDAALFFKQYKYVDYVKLIDSLLEKDMLISDGSNSTNIDYI